MDFDISMDDSMIMQMLNGETDLTKPFDNLILVLRRRFEENKYTCSSEKYDSFAFASFIFC